MADLEPWKFILTLVSIIATIAAPTIWHVRSTAAKSEKNNKALVDQVLKTSESSVSMMREDLKDFRNHFDSRTGTMHEFINQNNREIKEHIAKELTYIKDRVDSIEKKTDDAKERSHTLEKDFLEFQKEVGMTFVSKEYLDLALEKKQMLQQMGRRKDDVCPTSTPEPILDESKV